MRLWRWSFVLVAASALLACVPRADKSRPVPTALLPSDQGSRRLVVVLPGRRDRLESLRRSGVGEAIQRTWPDADVLFAELSLPFYLDRSATRRLHNEVLMPARRRAYTEIWLVGASLGGMGAMLYDRDYPGQVDGIVLLAPYTGERAIHDEIRAAGGVANWDPAAGSDKSGEEWQREIWRHMKTWANEPKRTANVWLAYGRDDYLREGMPLIEPLLPAGHVLLREGGHTWSVWSSATADALRAARPQSEPAADP